MLEYTIAQGRTIADLLFVVKLLIKDNWKPTGGLAADDYHLFQAMTRELPE
jgi:hypothetical protein